MPLTYAAPWRRGAAFLLDLAMTAPLGWLFSPPVWLGAGAAVSAVCQGSGWQRTPGKALLGMKLMEANGRGVGWARAGSRALLQYWAVHQMVAIWTRPYRLPAVVPYDSGLPLDVLEWALPRLAWAWAPMLLALTMLLVDRRRRTWWDRVCGTSVISLPPSEVMAERQKPDRA